MLSLVPHLPHLSNEGRAALGLVKQGVVPTCLTFPTFSNRDVCNFDCGRYGAHTAYALRAEGGQEGQVRHHASNHSTLLSNTLPHFMPLGEACLTSTSLEGASMRREVAIAPTDSILVGTVRENAMPMGGEILSVRPPAFKNSRTRTDRRRS